MDYKSKPRVYTFCEISRRDRYETGSQMYTPLRWGHTLGD